ncbi:hypothetical protein IAT40_007247 [Kwoniella sp. CBS 6097]
MDSEDQSSCEKAKVLLESVKISHLTMGPDTEFMRRLEMITIGAYDNKMWSFSVSDFMKFTVTTSPNQHATRGPTALTSSSREDPGLASSSVYTPADAPTSVSVDDRQLRGHPEKWGLIYPLLELLKNSP